LNLKFEDLDLYLDFLIKDLNDANLHPQDLCDWGMDLDLKSDLSPHFSV